MAVAIGIILIGGMLALFGPLKPAPVPVPVKRRR